MAGFEAQICEKFKITSLTDNQIKSINAVVERKDVFVGTKTGSGKSLTYESIPVVFPGSCVLVIAPLVSIMSEQCLKLSDLGFKSTYIGKDVLENDMIENAMFDFVFGSPEQLVGDVKMRTILQSHKLKEKLKAIVIDEAHTVIQWGEANKGDEPFREWFSKIGEMRSLCGNVPMIALTATTSPSQRRRIMKMLCFTANAEVVVESPDRNNIKISAICIPNKDNLESVFNWLIEDLKTLKEKCPRHVIFCETISDVSKLYYFFVEHFGKKCGLIDMIDMYHSKTNDKVKTKIRHDMTVDGKIRILVCTNAAGMGVNFYGLNNIIHYGLPRDMDTFVQQMGRGGRDGEQSDELVLFKSHKGHLKKVESELVKLVKDDSECRHKMLCSAYLVKKSQISPLHNCCDVCEKQCSCGDDECPRGHAAKRDVNRESDESDEDQMTRTVSSQERQLLRQKLEALKFRLTVTTAGTLIHSDVLHGFTDNILEDIVKKCDTLFTADDVVQKFEIWSYETAVEISNIITDVFGDCAMYNLDDSDSDTQSY